MRCLTLLLVWPLSFAAPHGVFGWIEECLLEPGQLSIKLN
jgi:hypothetical protein